MFGIPADTALAWANVISVSGLAVATAGAVTAYLLSARVSATHSLELQQAQSQARTQIESAAAQANTRTAELVRVNEDLQRELQSEQEARKRMSAQLQMGEVTREQMAKFVDTIKGLVRQINLFTAPDREASIFGITIMDALQEADVSVTWYRMKSAPTFGQGFADHGVTIYEYPRDEKDESVARTLARALTTMDVQPHLLTPAQPLWDFPSPSLIIAPRPPEFLRASQEPVRSPTMSTAISGLFSHAE